MPESESGKFHAPASKRLPIVCVVGGSGAHFKSLRTTYPESHERALQLASELGSWLAGLQVNLMTGGGGGVMEAVSEGFHQVNPRAGKVIGILPGPIPPPGYPNPFIEIVIQSHLPGNDPMAESSRNHINVLSADLIIALPGGSGTYAEMKLAKQYEKPLVAIISEDDRIGGRAEQELVSEGYSTVETLAGIRDFVSAQLAGPESTAGNVTD